MAITATELTMTATKATTMTASYAFLATVKPLPTLALPFLSEHASYSLPTTFPFSQTSSRPVPPQPCCRSNRSLIRKPQLAQGIIREEPANPCTLWDYSATGTGDESRVVISRIGLEDESTNGSVIATRGGCHDRSRECGRRCHQVCYYRETSHEQGYDRGGHY